MTDVISQASNYAIKALIYISCEGKEKPENERYFRVKNISKKTKVPTHYLGKILQKLVRKNIVLSITGPRGGFSLARKSDEISLLDIILAIDGDSIINSCFMGTDRCSENNCPMHQTWGQTRDKMVKKLKSVNLTQVIKQGNWKDICE